MTRLRSAPAKERLQSKPVSTNEKTETPNSAGCHQLEGVAALTNNVLQTVRRVARRFRCRSANQAIVCSSATSSGV